MKKEEENMNTKNQNTKNPIKVKIQNLIGIPLSTLINWLFMFGGRPNLENRFISC